MGSPKRRSILVVDDYPDNLELMQAILGREYEIILARNGEAALQLVADPNHLPDLILLDVLMPKMDGYEVFDQLRHSALTNKIPVIFISALADQEHVLKGVDLGALDYLTKPISPAVLLERIKGVLPPNG